MNKKIIVILLNVVMSVIAFGAPKNIILFVGDGLGSVQRQISEYYIQEKDGNQDKLMMDQLPVIGINTTHSLNSLITDSAASATAIATGEKTNSGMISMLPNGKKLDTVFKFAQESGMKTGLVTTTRLTHATPAAFATHNISRGNENEIAEEYLTSNVDFLVGGGYRNFIPSTTKGSRREDNLDLTKEFQKKGYKVFVGEDSAKSFENTNFGRNDKVFATFTSSHMPYEVDRVTENMSVPSLTDMTKKGIETLSKGKDGFILMVEAGRIDHAAHANDVKGVIDDTLALDSAVKEAYKFYEANKEDTLIIVMGDHETGGLGLGYGTNYKLDLESLVDVKHSINDGLYKKYTGNDQEFFNFLAKDMNLSNLTKDEKQQIEKAMVDEKTGDYDKNTYGGYSPTSIAVAHVLSKRANVMFTTYAHTATQIPMSSVGVGAEEFGGFLDNTEVGKKLIKMVR